jgi:hypothetical protein
MSVDISSSCFYWFHTSKVVSTRTFDNMGCKAYGLPCPSFSLDDVEIDIIANRIKMLVFRFVSSNKVVMESVYC